MKKSIYALLLLTVGFFAPQFSFAQTLTDGNVVSSCLSLTSSNLTYGAFDSTTGGEVSMLQDFLITKGMLTTSTGGPTGYYGSLTVVAVKTYQTSKGFTPVGVVGPLTKSAIASDTGCNGSNSTPISASPGSTGSVSVPSITTSSLPTATVGVEYGAINLSISSSGGSGIRTWSITSGSLPSGIRLSPPACTIGVTGDSCSQPASIPLVGIPTTAGTYTFTITITVGTVGTQSASKQFMIVVNPAPSTSAAPVISLTTSTSTVVSGGTAKIGWAAVPSAGINCAAAGGNLAAGLTINPSGEWVTPPLYTTTQYGIMCTNTIDGLVSYKYVTISVIPSVSLSTGPSIALTTSTALPIVPGGKAHITWSVSPSDSTITCRAAGGNLASGQTIGTYGSWDTPALYTTTQYGIQCTNPFGKSSYKYLTINVSEASGSSTVSLTQSADSTLSGSPYTLRLSSFNTVSCAVTYTVPDGGGTISDGPTSGTLNLSTTIAGTYTATASCKTSSGNTIQSSLTHTVTTAIATAPVVTLLTSSSTVTYGGKATITWRTDPATGITCVAAGGNLAAGMSINSSGTWETPALYTSVTYGIQCKNTSNNLVSYKYVTINVTSPSSSTSAPAITLTPDLTVASGGTVTLSWNVSPSTNVTCAAASGAVAMGTNIGTTGYYLTPKLYTTTTYGLRCTDNGTGLASYKYVKVTVLEQATADAPVITFTTSSSTVSFGGTATLRWSTSPLTNVVCAAAGGNLAAGSRIDSSGSWVTPPLYSTTQYGIGCTNTVNNLASYKYVTVNLAQQASQASAPVVTTKGSGTISYGGTATASWSVTPSTNVSCVAAGGELPSGTPINTSGTWTTSKLYTTTQYVIRCTDNSTRLAGYGYITVTVPTQGNAETSSSLAVNSTGAVLGASASTCIDLPYNMYRGFESNSVTMLQTFLVSRGLLYDNPTGFYGDMTVSAVREYQSMKSLPITGMVYDFTRAAIKADTCQ